uniref:Uncharacterized protein n=1 Tax=Magnetococcus massalia (strain MO-1) TaxID=451514 RepID=A0A1S7LP89_MAGMO|nr:Protein of unknown function [Candidatus Magnetococcus massalia]
MKIMKQHKKFHLDLCTLIEMKEGKRKEHITESQIDYLLNIYKQTKEYKAEEKEKKKHELANSIFHIVKKIKQIRADIKREYKEDGFENVYQVAAQFFKAISDSKIKQHYNSVKNNPKPENFSDIISFYDNYLYMSKEHTFDISNMPKETLYLSSNLTKEDFEKELERDYSEYDHPPTEEELLREPDYISFKKHKPSKISAGRIKKNMP